MNIVIIGGVAAGAKVAAKSRRLLKNANIDIYTDDTHVSYSSCGLPYYIQGDFEDYKKLLIRSPEEFAKDNINVHLEQKVIKIISKTKKIIVKNLKNNNEYIVPYDKLVIATGARANIPDIDNNHLKNIFTLRKIEDGINIKEKIKTSKHITIVGGGYIGIEILEGLIKNKKSITLMERSSHLMSNLDNDIADLITEFVKNKSENYLNLLTNDKILSFQGKDKVERIITSNGEEFESDMVIFCAGIKPNVEIAKEAGIEIGETGAIKVNSRMQTNIEDIYACGDCVEEMNIITQQPVWIPLGTNANKEGRCAAINLAGFSEDFEGVLGSSVTRFFSLTISKTGLTEKYAKSFGFDTVSVLSTKRDKAGYMPNVEYITLKLIADKRTHKILGGQAIGSINADKKINTLSLGLWSGITAEELADADMTYAPPFSTATDILSSTAKLLIDKLK